MSFQDLQQKIISFHEKKCGKGATQDEISLAQVALGVRFPCSYEQFLHEYGWAKFKGEMLYGLGSDVPPYLELVKNTVIERNAMKPALPQHLVPVMNDGAGNHYCLDTSRMNDGECPIVFWDHELGEDQIPELICGSFDAWLQEILHDLQ